VFILALNVCGCVEYKILTIEQTQTVLVHYIGVRKLGDTQTLIIVLLGEVNGGLTSVGGEVDSG
jgi:hypothetical protein